MRLTAAAVLFDMDGTLVDSTAMVEAVWSEFAEANRVDARAVIDFAHGRPSRDTIAKFVADTTRIDEWLDWIHTAEGERFTEVTTIPGAREAVLAIPLERWAVVTSAIHHPAHERLTQNGFPPPPVLIGADDVTHGKPNPEGYLAAASALGVVPEDCVVFEDTIAGIEAGLAAGCAVVAVGNVEANGIAGRIRDFTAVTVEATGEGLTITFP
ncbi:HAD-IA family hydrolase [Demequina sp.]|uniref:HAD-IA family hydrolase n=1 Tax=Demequina sp. TaxID=2050685 RepID=UPI003D0ABDED